MGKVEEQVNGDANESVADVKIERPEYEELIKMVNIVSKPLASKKMTKKVYKLVKKAAKAKELRRGVKETCKALRKKEKGIVIFAGDVSPIDCYSHMPVMCEDAKLPYVFVPARIDLGLASQTKRATSVVMIKKSEDYGEAYTELKSAIKELPLPI